MTIPNETYWTVDGLCREFDLNPLTVRSWIKAGSLKTLRLGIRHRIYQSQWEQLVADSNATGDNK